MDSSNTQSQESVYQTQPDDALQTKVDASLLSYVYKQSTLGQISSLICASILFGGLYELNGSNSVVSIWYGFVLVTFAFRHSLTQLYQKYGDDEDKVLLWKKLFILGALLSGLSWGMTGGIVFINVTEIQRTLIILILSGITASSVPLLAAEFTSALIFLSTALLPLIVQLMLVPHSVIYKLFDFSLAAYYLFLIILSKRINKMIAHNIKLGFENDKLFKNISDTNNKLEVSNKKLEEAATHDALTHLANRNLFNIAIKEAINRARRFKKPIVLFYIDLDKFKAVNDHYGHDIGDLLLIEVTDRIRNCVREIDITYRLGGDEMTILLENIEDITILSAIAQRVCDAVAQPIIINGITLDVSASIGISIYPVDGSNPELLLKSADKAMYYAKNHGGNSFAFSTEVDKVKLLLSHHFNSTNP